jgi:acyl-CoA thioesterase FadM
MSEPERHVERLRLVTRGYEVASNGAIPPSQLLRYIEHVRWRTIATSEILPARRFFGMGVVRAQALETFRRVSFDAELEISMWLSRVGKTSMDFSHEVVEVEDGKVVARSTATMVSLDASRNPAPIDAAANEYVVERDRAVIDRLDAEPPDDAWERSIQVRPSDEDLQGHVNQARYADYIEDTRKLCVAAGGYGPGDWDGAARRLVISYEREARTGDPVVARTFRSRKQDRTVDFVLYRATSEIATLGRVEIVRR